MSTARRQTIVLGTLMVAMTAAAAGLHLILPGTGAGRGAVPANPAAAGAREPLTIDGPERAWSRLEVRLAGPEADRSQFHFVIGSVAGADGAVTSVKPLWRNQRTSPLDRASAAGSGIFVALVRSDPESVPDPGQWQALGLLTQQLHGRYGLARIAFDDGLQSDPRTRGIKTVAGW